jgi:ubiquinone/menaquinone biosynthesis C-methylase UbiE
MRYGARRPRRESPGAKDDGMNDSGDLIRQQFGAHAHAYATSAVHAQGTSLARLVELTQPQHHWIVLDVSTGAGHTALVFAPHVARVVATDLTPEMLDEARRLAQERAVANVEFKPADAHVLPFEDNTFDLVTNRIALHHYLNARKAVAEMTRVCQRGGIVALVDNVVPPDRLTAFYINDFEKLRDPSHNWTYPVAQLEAYFAKAQLRVEHVETIRKELEFESWAKRMGASAKTKAQLRALLRDAPDGVRAFLTPRTAGKKLFFSLTEAIIIGRKV